MSTPTPTPPETPAEAPVGAAAAKPWYRGPLLAIPILGGLIVIAIIVGAIVITVAAAPRLAHAGANTARPTARPTPTAAASDAASGASGSCWNGSKPKAGKCPALTGEDALHWVFPLDHSAPDFVCKAADPSQFDPTGAIDLVECEWNDLPGSYVILGRWPDSTAQAGWTTYMQNNFSNATVSRFQVDGEDAGISITGSSDTSIEEVYGYDVAPFFIDTETDFDKGGTTDQEDTANARVLAKHVSVIQAALDAAH